MFFALIESRHLTLFRPSLALLMRDATVPIAVRPDSRGFNDTERRAYAIDYPATVRGKQCRPRQNHGVSFVLRNKHGAFNSTSLY
jgi:hypothetical protein